MISISSSRTSDNSAPDQLSGPSALALQLVCLVASCICLLSLVPGAIAVVARAPATLMVVAVSVMLLSFFTMVATLVAWFFVSWREAGAGYTTLRNQWRHLPQLDPRSGRVVREAGAPYLPPRRRGV